MEAIPGNWINHDWKPWIITIGLNCEGSIGFLDAVSKATGIDGQYKIALSYFYWKLSRQLWLLSEFPVDLQD